MFSLRRRFVIGLGAFYLCIASSPASSSQTEAPDAFKIFSAFTDVAAVLDTNNDPMFKCLTSKRINFDPDAPSATYQWTLNVQGSEDSKHPVVLYTPASTPEAAVTVINSDTENAAISRFLYTDYKTCAVLEENSYGHQCTLWVAPDLKDSVPQDCVDKFTVLCGEGVSLYDINTCGQ